MLLFEKHRIPGHLGVFLFFRMLVKVLVMRRFASSNPRRRFTLLAHFWAMRTFFEKASSAASDGQEA